MTKEEALDMCMEVRHYLTQGNPIWDKDKVGEALNMAIETLEDRPKGHWKMYDIYDFKGRISGERAIICDRCLMKEIIRFGQSKWNFCPNCGADMREEWGHE